MDNYLFLAQILIWMLALVVGHEAVHVVTAKLFGGYATRLAVVRGGIAVSLEIPDRTTSAQKAAIFLSPLTIIPILILTSPLTYLYDSVLVGILVTFVVTVSGSLYDFIDVYRIYRPKPVSRPI